MQAAGKERGFIFSSKRRTHDIMTAIDRPRVFLLLQGPMSYFFTYLGRALRARGAVVKRINVCPGDALFWRGPGGESYRGRPDDWPAYVARFIADHGVTDIVSLGDGRRWHADALPLAHEAGVRVHVIEQGYIRPHYLTVEPDGTGGHTRFPRDWYAIAKLAELAPTPHPGFTSSFLMFSVMDVAFNLANILFSWALYPHFKQHALDHPLREWGGWIFKKALRLKGRRAMLEIAEGRVKAHQGPLYVFPLQLETDYQIRLHGPPKGLRETLKRIIASFRAHAPDDAMLAIKLHPLDNGWTPWQALIAAEVSGIEDRVAYLDGGDLDSMLAQAAGCVVINSTVGLTALTLGAPVMALGTAIYDLDELTWQGDLDTFWTSAAKPDEARLALFLRALTAAIQVPGGFDGTGAEPGAANMADRMIAPPPY